MTSDDLVRLVTRFEDGTLPKAEWTHQAHLAVALWYASRLSFEEALVRPAGTTRPSPASTYSI